MKYSHAILTLLFVIFAVNIYAQISQSPAEEQRLLEERERIEEDIRRSLIPPTKTEIPQAPAPFDIVRDDDVCFTLKEVYFDNITIISPKKLKNITKKYIGGCITPDLINAVITDVNNAFISKKAITSRVFLPIEQDNLNDGVLKLYGLEGTVEEFELIENNIVKNGFFPKLKLKAAFPFQKDKILDLGRIEQGVDVLKSIPSQNVQMDIEPGASEGKSKVIIYNTTGDANSLKLTYDNSGSKSVHENKASMKYSRYGLFGLSDALSISASTDLEADAYSLYSRYLAVSYNISVGRLFFSETYSYGPTRDSRILINGDHMRNDSLTQNSYTDFEYMLLRSGSHKLIFGSNYTVKDVENFILVRDVRARVEVSSRTLSLISPYLKYNMYGANYVLYVKPAYIKGVNWFGTYDDKEFTYPQKGQYDAAKLTAYFYFNFIRPLSFTAFGDSQYANDRLFSQDMFFIGGEGSVRGYKFYTLGGEKGWNMQNDLTFAVGQVTQNILLRHFLLSAFIDVGMVNEKDMGDMYLSGYGCKLAFDHKNIGAYIVYARPLNYPSSFYTDDYAMYLSVDYKISF
ncbi:MAG: hypothetical protein LBH05_04350 [Deferribacteraceae bacterium]|jgi:hemolysin activation/secretion protein|nr:hypothetical protein [Deferribacteraceae bacterium]